VCAQYADLIRGRARARHAVEQGCGDQAGQLRLLHCSMQHHVGLPHRPGGSPVTNQLGIHRLDLRYDVIFDAEGRRKSAQALADSSAALPGIQSAGITMVSTQLRNLE